MDFLGRQPRGPRECNAAYATSIYRSAVNAMFGNSPANAKPLKSYLTSPAAFDVNGVKQSATPLLFTQLSKFNATMHITMSRPTRQRMLLYSFELRVNLTGSVVTLPEQRLVVKLDHECMAEAVFLLRVDSTEPSAVQQLFAPPGVPGPITCAEGELPRGSVAALAKSGNASECVPVSCASARACPTAPCTPLPATELKAAGGITFMCGCRTGFEANNHTLECVAVTCAARPCLPFATCVDLDPATLDNCNPTPTMGSQWRRGPEPCPLYQCVEMTQPPTTTTTTTTTATTATHTLAASTVAASTSTQTTLMSTVPLATSLTDTAMST